MFGKSYEVEVQEGKGGHGGGDVVLLQDLFGVPTQQRTNSTELPPILMEQDPS